VKWSGGAVANRGGHAWTTRYGKRRQMGPHTAARIKTDNVNWLIENKIYRLETNAIYAIGRKPS